MSPLTPAVLPWVRRATFHSEFIITRRQLRNNILHSCNTIDKHLERKRGRDTHTHTHRERERERERDTHTHTHTHTERERERERERRLPGTAVRVTGLLTSAGHTLQMSRV